MEKITTKPLYWITGTALFLCIGAYVWRFHDGFFSDSPEKWGQLGDYIGGLINPLAALLNVYVAIQIAREVSKFGEKQTKQQLDTQKELVRNELLYQILSRFQNDCDRIKGHGSVLYPIRINQNKSDHNQGVNLLESP